MKGTKKNRLGKIEKNQKVKEGDCIFPFEYKWKSHNECVETEKGKICATSVTDRNTLKTYGYCEESDSIKEYTPKTPRKKDSPHKMENDKVEIVEELIEKISEPTEQEEVKQEIVAEYAPKSPRKKNSPHKMENNINIKQSNLETTKQVNKEKNMRYNEEFIKIMEELADIMARQGEPFKSRAYKKAAETIMIVDEDISNLDILKGKPGIGKTILEKLKEYMNTGTLRILERERNNPLNLFTKIYGVGPKKAQALIEKEITTIDKLKENADLLNDTQKIGLKYYDELQERIPRNEIDLYAEKFSQIFDEVKDKVPGSFFDIVGSYRRGAKNSGDIDVIITNKNNDKKIFDLFLDKLIKDGIVIETLTRGKTKSLTIGKLPDHIPRRIDFLYSDYDEYPFAILYFTGSKSFNTNMRQLALKRGYSLNEHGFTKMDGKSKSEKLDKKFQSEQDIFDFLNMEYKEPKDRIDGRSIVLQTKEKTPEKQVTEITPTPVITEKTKITETIELPENKEVEQEKQEVSEIIVEKPKEKKKSPKNKTLKKPKFNTTKAIESIKKDGIEALKILTQKEIETIIKKANDAYYNNKTLMSDNVYDIVKEYLEANYSESTILDEIGAPVEKNKVKLPYFMPSMDKIKPNTNAIVGYVEKYSGPYVISAKLDGVSGLYSTEGDKAKLFTRGNGEVGQDISHLIPYLNLPDVKDATCRGEIIIKKSLFEEKYKDKFSNARNMVSGIVNQKKSEKNKFKDIDFVAYEVIKPLLKPSEQMEYLKNNKFNVVINQEEEKITNDLLSALLVNWRSSYEYEIDGIIVSNDKIYDRKNENPDHAFAFKMVLSDQVAEAKVVNVFWTPSKDGYLKPKIQIEPVVLGGAKIEYATAFNAAFVEQNKIGIGSIIEIVRSGDVIPHILKVHEEQGVEAKMPDVPYIWNDTHVDIMLVNPEKDEKVIETNIKLFFQGLDVAGLGEGNVKKIVEAGFDTIDKVVNMKEEDFLKVENFKSKMAKKVYESIQEKINEASLEKIMGVSNIFGRGFGEKKIKPILEIYPDILTSSDNREDKLKKVLMVKGMAEKTATKFVDNIDKFVEFLKKINQTEKLNKETKESSAPKINHELTNKRVLFTGFRDKELMKKLENLGAELDNAISKNTFAVIVKDEEGKTTTKAQKAKDKGIPIYNIVEFKEKFNL